MEDIYVITITLLVTVIVLTIIIFNKIDKVDEKTEEILRKLDKKK